MMPEHPRTPTPHLETRKAPRRDAALVAGITNVRLSPHGAAARLVNISTSGALVETTARIQPGCSVTLQFEGGFEPAVIDARVARATIVAVGSGGALQYQIGVAFKSPIALPALPESCVDSSSILDRRGAPAASPSATPMTRPVANRW